jgi:hypothetical protein
MTPQQLTTLVNALKASVNPTVVSLLAARNDWELCAWCNADASPQVKAWRFVPKVDIFKAWDASELDNVSAASKRETLWNLLNQAGGLDCSVAAGPKIITDLFPNASTPTSRAAILNIAWENASNAEVLMGGLVDVTSATPPTAITAKIRSWIGDVPLADLSRALNG